MTLLQTSFETVGMGGHKVDEATCRITFVAPLVCIDLQILNNLVSMHRLLVEGVSLDVKSSSSGRRDRRLLLIRKDHSLVVHREKETITTRITSLISKPPSLQRSDGFGPTKDSQEFHSV